MRGTSWLDMSYTLDGEFEMLQKKEATSPRKLVAATGIALLTAVVVLLVAVLPAEYGIDLLGTGNALGLLSLARVQPIAVEASEYRMDFVELKLHPSEWVEYTYRLEEGGSMLYSWHASGPVSYNFHSAPDDASPGYAESYDQQENDQAHGTYTALFSGIHGWYWENPGTEEVTITLTTAGFYIAAQEGRDRVSGFHPLMDIRGRKIQDGENDQ